MTASAQNKTEKDFTISRIFAAPRALVWKAWTDSELLAKWWGPEVFTVPVCKLDLSIGGVWHYCMRSPDGKEYWNKGVFTEITPPEKYVTVSSFSNAQGEAVSAAEYGMPDFPDEMTMTVTFEEQDGGKKTKVTVQQTMPDSVARGYGALEGWGGSFVKLDKLLAKA